MPQPRLYLELLLPPVAIERVLHVKTDAKKQS